MHLRVRDIRLVLRQCIATDQWLAREIRMRSLAGTLTCPRKSTSAHLTPTRTAVLK